MRLIKRLTRSDRFRSAACWLGAHYIRLVYHTTRWQVRGADGPQALWAAGQPFILAFWHGRLLLMPYCWDRRHSIHMLISAHADGQLIARTVHHFGIETIAGSSANPTKPAGPHRDRGGAAAYRAILRTLKRGGYVGITPDGPRGPRMRVAGAIVEAARRSGAPVLTCTMATTRRRLLGSWDRFALAWPFGRGVILWSPPLHVGRDETVEAARLRIEAAMNDLTAEADRLCGHPPVPPAAAAPEPVSAADRASKGQAPDGQAPDGQAPDDRAPDDRAPDDRIPGDPSAAAPSPGSAADPGAAGPAATPVR